MSPPPPQSWAVVATVWPPASPPTAPPTTSSMHYAPPYTAPPRCNPDMETYRDPEGSGNPDMSPCRGEVGMAGGRGVVGKAAGGGGHEVGSRRARRVRIARAGPARTPEPR